MRTETRTVRGFDAVTLTGAGTLVFTQDGKEGLTIEAEDNILPVLTSKVEGKNLILSTAPNTSINVTKPIRYRLSLKNLKALSISGAGDAQAKKLRTGDFTIDLSGSGSLRIENLSANQLSADISGAGSLDLAGKVSAQQITLSGAGSYKAAKLESNRTSLDISGAANAWVHARETLDTQVSGAGNVHYSGNPRVTKDISGAGSVIASR